MDSHIIITGIFIGQQLAIYLSSKEGEIDFEEVKNFLPTVEELACGKDVGDELVIMRPWHMHMGKTGRGMWAK